MCLQSQEVEFQKDEDGLPMGPGAVLCIAAGKRLEPQMTFEAFCDHLHNPPYKEYPDVVNRARVAIAEELEQNQERTLPVFIPGSNVARSMVCGHMVYSKAAALTDEDLTRLAGKSGEGLGLTAFDSWQLSTTGEPKQVKYYAVSLQGLPQETLDTCKRVKVYHTISASREHLLLTPQTMLSDTQHQSTFGHATDKYRQEQAPINVFAGDVKSLADLQQLATLIDSGLQKRMEGEHQPSRPAHDSKALAGLNLDAPTVTPPKKAQKRKTATPGVPALCDDAASQGDAGSASGASEKTLTRSDSAKQRKLSAELEGMDEEMKRVASLHCSSGKNFSAKSLQNLVAEDFMYGQSDHTKSHALVAVTWQESWLLLKLAKLYTLE